MLTLLWVALGVLCAAGAASSARAQRSFEWTPGFAAPGANAHVLAMCEFDDGNGGGPALYVGGGFTTAGGFASGYIAKWAWPLLPGDLNCDGTVDFADINPFVLYLSNFAAWQATYPACPPENGDINCDDTCGQGSFGDINPFVALLSGGG